MRTPCCLAGIALAMAARSARADIPIEILDRGATRLTLDGILRDWSSLAELTAVDEAVRVLRGEAAWRGADDAAFGFALARDDEGLWIAAEVRDDRVVRTRAHRDADDTLVVSLAVTAGARTIAWDLALQPGEPGAYAGAVRFRGSRGGAVPGAQLVEAPLAAGGGYTLEARIPWRALPELRANLGTLRGRVAYFDCDREASPATETVLATGPGDGAHPGSLPAATGSVGNAGPGNLLAVFQLQHELGGAQPVLDRAADLTGGRAQERVVVYPRYVVAFGPDIQGGRSYVFAELPTRNTSEVLEATLRDLTGDGRPELWLRLRIPTGSFEREIGYVYGISAAGELARFWAHELARGAGPRRVHDRVAFEPGGRIRVSVGGVEGFTAQTYPGAVDDAIPPPLTPWGPRRAELYAWNGGAGTFALERVEPGVGAPATAGVERAPAPVETAPPADVAGVVQLFFQRAGVAPGTRPALRAEGDVAEDAAPEQVHVYGRTLLVVGSRFLAGRSYYSLELPCAAGEDVLSLRLADVTGDGRAEVLVRVRRASTVTVRGASVNLEKEFLLAYAIEQPHRGRVFAAEVARRVGDASVVNAVRLPAARRGAEIVLEAGAARGWSAESYPFRDGAAQGFEPLLLPWDPAARRVVYRWNGTSFARAP